MAWNQPDDDQGGRARGSGLRAPPGNSLWARWRKRWNGTPQARGPMYAVAAGIALALWVGSGFYQIDEGERGVLQRFGAYEGLRSGAGWHLPWPIETLTIVNLDKINSADFQGRMFTADAMLVNFTASVEYQYGDARAALFALRDPDSVVREVGEAVTRELVGQRRIEDLMSGVGRPALALALRHAVQAPLDAMGAGLRVTAVNIADVQVPEAVLSAQRELVQAGVERDRLTHEAEGYAADVVPAAQGLAQRQRLEAETYKVQTIGTAEGEAARFAPLAAAYAHAPEITRDQLYIETVESILAHSRKVIIDGNNKNTLVLPLDKFSDAGALKALGITAVAPASVAVTGTAAATASPASTPPTAGTSAAAGTATPAVPAATASPAAVPAEGLASDGADRDDRGRERGDRR